MSTRCVRNSEQSASLPPLLVSVIHAARHAPSELVDRKGHDAALFELGHWALVRVPAEGVLAPHETHAYELIEEIANRHLAFSKVRAGVTDALSLVEPFETRARVESAYDRFRSVSDDTYYYAGLACGIALAHFSVCR
jgi:hypothetical protein